MLINFHFYNSFSYTFYRFTMDSRGRKYYQGSLNPTSNPLFRSFLSLENKTFSEHFINELNIEDQLNFSVSLINNNITNKNYLNEIKNVSLNFIHQIKLIYNNYNECKEYSLNEIINITTTSENKIKIGDLFKLISYILDFQEFRKNPHFYIFKSNFSLDATNSGIQILLCLIKVK